LPDVIVAWTGRIAPEAALGGPIAVVQRRCHQLDVARRAIDVELTDSRTAARPEAWTAPPPRYETV
jgi:dihydroxyacid dehydratase/phosphogluconate dehydratase